VSAKYTAHVSSVVISLSSHFTSTSHVTITDHVIDRQQWSYIANSSRLLVDDFIRQRSFLVLATALMNARLFQEFDYGGDQRRLSGGHL